MLPIIIIGNSQLKHFKKEKTMNKREFTQEQKTELMKNATKTYYATKRCNYAQFNAIGEIHLLSYASVVVSINTATKTITFYPHTDYSNTTMKHVCAFLDNVLNTRIYAKERRQAIKDGYVTINQSRVMDVTYSVYYSEYQPIV